MQYYIAALLFAPLDEWSVAARPYYDDAAVISFYFYILPTRKRCDFHSYLIIFISPLFTRFSAISASVNSLELKRKRRPQARFQ